MLTRDGNSVRYFGSLLNRDNIKSYINRLNGNKSSASLLDTPASVQDIKKVFGCLLGRELEIDPGHKTYIDAVLARRPTIFDYIKEVASSEEFTARIVSKTGYIYSREAVDDYRFRLPDDLCVVPFVPQRVLLVGSCLLEWWYQILKRNHSTTEFELIIFNNASRPPPMREGASYDFQLVQIPLRSVVREADYSQISYHDHEKYEQCFARAVNNLSLNLEAALRYNVTNKLQTFILNFSLPQQNHMGRGTDRYSLANPVHFVERLNQELYRLAKPMSDVHVIDFDQIVSSFGRKYFQDDSITHWNHGSYIGSGFVAPADDERLEPIGDRRAIYLSTDENYIETVYNEALATIRSLRQIDSIKLVIFDLDDTLWRGVAAERDRIVSELFEGWPLGILEAATYLWKRGIMLAIVSKNDEAKAEAIWNQIYAGILSLDKFVVRKINWRPKAENIKSILDAVNILPQNVLFVDDNPVERAAVKAAFPTIRTLDAPLAHWRRILLWAPETQVVSVTEESAARTAMVRAQIEREETRANSSKEEFLATLGVKLRIGRVTSVEDPSFVRCFELVNKTNQFNTTGRRWASAEIAEFLASGGVIHYADVSDNYTPYGIVGVMLSHGSRIEQFVMSCRVFGMDIEKACITAFCNEEGGNGNAVSASIIDTGKNHLAHTLYGDMGFVDHGSGNWSLSADRALCLPRPAHIVFVDP